MNIQQVVDCTSNNDENFLKRIRGPHNIKAQAGQQREIWRLNVRKEAVMSFNYLGEVNYMLKNKKDGA